MTAASEPVACWNCTRSSPDTQTCGWCGVWLVDLDPTRVPPAAADLLPLARRWGIPDDGHRSDAINQADHADLETIVRALQDDAVWDEIDPWLAGPEASAAHPSREYVAITCLTIAADIARLRLARQRQTPDTYGDERQASVPDPATGDGPPPTWPPDTLNALRLGRRLVAEVPAGPGRRAFVDITPTSDARDAEAEREGWQRPDNDRAFRVEHWDYDEQQIDGCDYDIGARRVRAATAASEVALLELLAGWGLQPTDFTYPWKTADPR